VCELPFSVSTDCLVAQLKPSYIKKFEIKFIYYFLSGNIRILEAGFKGIGLKHISKGYIDNINIPDLSIEDQKRIVKILDEADALRQKRKQAIGLLDDYLKSVFLETAYGIWIQMEMVFGIHKRIPKQILVRLVM
jgi:type I restriction enzyme S subunit